MRRALTGATLLAAALLAGCGSYSGPQTGNIAPASISTLTADEAARLYPKANACVEGEFYGDLDWSQPLMIGPGFEACPGIIADLKAKYLADKAQREAAQSAAAAKAEADDLAKRRKIIADP